MFMCQSQFPCKTKQLVFACRMHWHTSFKLFATGYVQCIASWFPVKLFLSSLVYKLKIIFYQKTKSSTSAVSPLENVFTRLSLLPNRDVAFIANLCLFSCPLFIKILTTITKLCLSLKIYCLQFFWKLCLQLKQCLWLAQCVIAYHGFAPLSDSQILVQ